MTTLRAFAKVNLSLRVRPLGDDGFHPILSLVQSIDLEDEVTVDDADGDSMTVEGDARVPADESNTAWRAADAVRQRLTSDHHLAVSVVKRIPSAAGLGGGSADGAAALVAAAGLLGGTRSLVETIAPAIGSDVPVCVIGGTLWVEGRGERLRPAQVGTDYFVAVATADFPLSTAEVFRKWDALGGPVGPGIVSAALPPTLRREEPLINDLTPAAIALRPELGDWMHEVAIAWGQQVIMTGSGPTVIGFFPSLDEASGAASMVSARFAAGAKPIDRGWDGRTGGTLPPPPWGVV